MPFTASHSAAVLPFIKLAGRYRAASALVIGSMVPDFAYFIPWPRTTIGSHSLIGVLTLCLPVGLVAVITFELVLRRPLAFLLPASLDHLISARPEPIPRLHMAIAPILALLVGAYTHILWDGLTDPNGIMLGHAAWGRRNLVTIGGYNLFVYRLAEHCGTFIGAVAVAWYVRRSRRRQPLRPAYQPPEERLRRVTLTTVLTISAAAGVYAGARADLPSEWLQAVRYFLHHSVIWVGRIGGLLLCVYAIFWWGLHHELWDGDRANRARSLS